MSLTKARVYPVLGTAYTPTYGFVPVLLPQVKRLSLAAVSTETALTEAKSKVEGLARQLKNVQRRIEASEDLERDLKRLGQEAEEMHQKSHRVLEEKQVRYLLKW